MVLQRLSRDEVAPEHIVEFCPSEFGQNAFEFEGEWWTFEKSDTRGDICADKEGA